MKPIRCEAHQVIEGGGLSHTCLRHGNKQGVKPTKRTF